MGRLLDDLIAIDERIRAKKPKAPIAMSGWMFTVQRGEDGLASRIRASSSEGVNYEIEVGRQYAGGMMTGLTVRCPDGSFDVSIQRDGEGLISGFNMTPNER